MRELKFREIKFRAFDTENKTWTFATLGDLICGACTEKGDKPLSGAKQVWEQYTGLNDKNGKEICEGDIIKDKWADDFHKGIYEVKYDEERAGFVPFAKGDGCGCCEEDTIGGGDYAEIIGNIHENPELLEEEK